MEWFGLEWTFLKVIAEQLSHRIKDFSVLLIFLPARKLGLHKKFKGNTIRMADPNVPKGRSVAYDVMCNNESWKKKKRKRRGNI